MVRPRSSPSNRSPCPDGTESVPSLFVAVNILLWASTGIESTKGFAVWDLFRAEDADKVNCLILDE